jgi:Fe-S-cluster containining protein
MEDNKTLQSLFNVATLYREYDIAQALLEHEIGTSICAGCGRCCEINTPFAYGVEAANAVSRLLGDGKLYEFQRRIEGWLLERHRQCTIYEPLKVTLVRSELSQQLKDEMLALSSTQCPFYENHRCLIHAYRPLVCRATNVTRNGCTVRPPGKGETLEQRRIVPVDIRQQLQAEVEAVRSGVPKPTWAMAGFFPTLIFAHAWPNEFAKMVSDGRVATAKLVMTDKTWAVIFEEQLESNAEKDIFRTHSQKELRQKMAGGV